MTSLVHRKCVPCEGGTKPLERVKINEYLKVLNKEWEVINDKEIRHEFAFKNFVEAVEFVNKVSDIAESEGHHPDILIHAYKKVKIMLSTHAIGGLSENDFILAAKIEEIINS
jgi:4a-hydroxytetrahydrobiopterin dehydratase